MATALKLTPCVSTVSAPDITSSTVASSSAPGSSTLRMGSLQAARQAANQAASVSGCGRRRAPSQGARACVCRSSAALPAGVSSPWDLARDRERERPRERLSEPESPCSLPGPAGSPLRSGRRDRPSTAREQRPRQRSACFLARSGSDPWQADLANADLCDLAVPALANLEQTSQDNRPATSTIL